MRILDQNNKNPVASVMDGNFLESDPSRPYKWRKDIKEREVIADYQQRYSIGDGKEPRLRSRGSINDTNKSSHMGPFYEKYMKKLGQEFVKERVRRLKETFEIAAKKGQMGNFPLNASHNNFGSTNQDYRANDTLFTEGDDYKDDRQRLSSQDSNGDQESQRQYKKTKQSNFATQSVFSAIT